MPIHDFLDKKSTFFENVHTHRFLADLLVECVLRSPPVFLDVLRSEVDDGGIDLVVTDGKVIRYIQLKARAESPAAKPYKISERLLRLPGSCVIWIRYNKSTLAPLDYYFLGGLPTETIANFENFSKFDKRGEEKVGNRWIKMNQATNKRISIAELAGLLFPQEISR